MASYFRGSRWVFINVFFPLFRLMNDKNRNKEKIGIFHSDLFFSLMVDVVETFILCQIKGCLISQENIRVLLTVFRYTWRNFVKSIRSVYRRKRKKLTKIKWIRCMKVTPVGGLEWIWFLFKLLFFSGQVYLFMACVYRYPCWKFTDCFHCINGGIEIIDFNMLIVI